VVESDASGADSWAQRVWALPFLTVLAQRYHEQRNHRHKQLTDWARQMIRQVRRWLPTRTIVVVADSFCRIGTVVGTLPDEQPVHIITRLRLDAQLYQPAPLRRPNKWDVPGRWASDCLVWRVTLTPLADG